MDIIAILLIFVLILIVLFLRESLHNRLERIEHEIARLRDETSRPAPAPAATSAPAAPLPVAPDIRQSEPLRPPPRPRPVEPVSPKKEERAASVVIEPPHFRRIDEPCAPPATPSKPGFYERHPDLEKFIGENLISKIGIAILVLAIGFFVKYAIDNDWIGPVARVGVGMLCGGILIVIAHRMRNQYKAFSSVLVGGGLAVFYFTIALAYHQYQLFSQTSAFAIMLVVTAFSVLISLLYDRQELAIIALVGGFVTPFLVSNGRGNYVVLFSYLLILNTGLLVIAYNKIWRLLNILSFGFTALLFASWLLSLPYDAPLATYRGGWGFATAFYGLFFIINIAYTARTSKQFIASDFGILLANTGLYFAAGLYLIAQLRLEEYKGLYCAGMGIFHLGATWFLFRKSTADKNILYLLVGMTLSFVSLTAPLQLHGHYITLFWASEAVLLYWLFLRSRIGLIRVASLLVWGAMLVSLAMDWMNIYDGSYFMKAPGKPALLPIVFNKGCMTGLYAAVSCWALFYFRRDTAWSRITFIVSGAILLLTGVLETGYQFTHRFPECDLWVLYVLLYGYLCLLAFAWTADHTLSARVKRAGGGLLAAGLSFYLCSLVSVFTVQRYMLETGRLGGHFWAHWAGDGLIALMLYRLVERCRTEKLLVEPILLTWILCIVTVSVLSAEGQLLINALFFSRQNSLEELARVYNKTSLPILWGLCSFAFMWMGMRHKFKPLRIVSLALFTLTLLKLFLFDIRNIPVAGKIAAFFSLGVLLLVVSFMYQRLKKIIIEDEEKKPI
jgi:uncharacterized membrane protein